MRTAILTIVNAAAEAYRGVIPADRWREPYMDLREPETEIAARPGRSLETKSSSSAVC